MNQLRAGAVLNYMVIILNVMVGLLYTPFMLRMMGPSEYGLYSLVASTISYLTILDFGLGNAVIRYTAKFRAEGKQAEQFEMFGMFFVIYLIIGIISLFAGSALYFNVDTMFGDTMTVAEMGKARIMMLFLIFNLAFTFPMSIFGSIITAYERFIFPRIVNISRIVLNTVVMICLLKMGYRAIAMVVVQTLFNVLSLSLNYLYCKKKLQIKIYFRGFKWDFLKEVAIFSFWIFLSVIMDKIYWSSGQFILGITVGTTAVAIFAVAIQLQHMYMTFATAISAVFLPRITGMVVTNNNTKEISDIFIKTGRIQYVIMSLVLSGFIVFGKKFILLWAGEEYCNSYYITLLFFICMLPDLIQNIGIVILQARNQVKFRAILGVAVAVVSLFLQLILSKRYDEIGCAIAIASMFFIGQGVIMNIYYSRKQGLSIISFWKEICKMSVVPIVLTAVSLYILKSYSIDGWGELFASIIVFCAIYIPLFWIFSMNKYEKNLIISPINKILRRA